MATGDGLRATAGRLYAGFYLPTKCYAPGARNEVGGVKEKQYRSGLMASVHETAEGLHQSGLMSKRTLREFDKLCLTPVRPFPPRKIRAPRLREGAT